MLALSYAISVYARLLPFLAATVNFFSVAWLSSTWSRRALYRPGPAEYAADMHRLNRLSLVCRAAVLMTLLGASWGRPAFAGDEVILFNGNDLSGWHVECKDADRSKVFWKVETNSIVCDSIGRRDHDYVWLVSDREFADFEIRVRFQAYRGSPGNSGLQFRSRFDKAAGGGWLDGPQVDIHPPSSANWRTGFIYDETREEKRWVFPSLKDWNIDAKYRPGLHVFKYAEEGDAWNELVLICEGTRVKTIVNGIVVTDWNGAGVLDNAAHRKHNVGLSGHFALQLHSGDELRIRFKDIVVRER